jgi:cytochrome b pre-mRNA-processing protein 3
MFADMAHNLREIGLGDDGVTRQIQGMAQGFYGRAKAYDSALAQKDHQALVEALGRNLFRGHPPDSTILFKLAKYLREFVARLDAQPDSALIQGHLRLVEAEAQ